MWGVQAFWGFLRPGVEVGGLWGFRVLGFRAFRV